MERVAGYANAKHSPHRSRPVMILKRKMQPTRYADGIKNAPRMQRIASRKNLARAQREGRGERRRGKGGGKQFSRYFVPRFPASASCRPNTVR